MGEVIKFKKEKEEDFKEKFKEEFNSAKEKAFILGKKAWDNKETIAAVATAGITLGGKVMKLMQRYKSRHEIYDPSLHKNVRLKRRITKRMQEEIYERFRNGETLHNIYEDMGII